MCTALTFGLRLIREKTNTGLESDTQKPRDRTAKMRLRILRLLKGQRNPFVNSKGIGGFEDHGGFRDYLLAVP